MFPLDHWRSPGILGSFVLGDCRDGPGFLCGLDFSVNGRRPTQSIDDWLPGRRVLVARQWVQGVSCSESQVYVKLTRGGVQGIPTYNPR